MNIKCMCPYVKASQCNLNGWLLAHRAPFDVIQKNGQKEYQIDIKKIPHTTAKQMEGVVNVLNAQCEFCEKLNSKTR